MSFDTERLYQLLPAIYRVRDAEQGQPLKQLLSVIAEQTAVLEEDMAQLSDDQFIETCAEWVVPYIGDLLGVRGLNQVGKSTLSRRAEVANTIGYRRRKGTAAMLEQLASDVTEWPARVVEYFELLSTTQYMNHIRLGNLASPDLRQWQQLEYINGPFETQSHTADVRRIARQRGRYNIPNIGIFLWRLQSYPVTRSTARAVVEPNDGRFTFSPLGLDCALFNRPQTEAVFTHLSNAINLPDPLRRRVLYEELEGQRQAIADGQPESAIYFGEQPVLEVFVNGADKPIPAEEIVICDLSDPPAPIPDGWRRPPKQKDYIVKKDHSIKTLDISVAVDPVLGRIAFPKGVTPENVEVSFSYGFSDDIGGGPYNRSTSLATEVQEKVTWQIGVTQTAPAGDPDLVKTITEAVQKWNTRPKGTIGIIVIMDSRTYHEDLTGPNTIIIPEGSQLTIIAGDWPLVDAQPKPVRIIGQVTPDERRPHLRGSLAVSGPAATGSNDQRELVLNGLLIEGRVTVLDANLARLRVAHSTIFASVNSLLIQGGKSLLRINLDNTICGKIRIPDEIQNLLVTNSIIDFQSGTAIGAPETPIDISETTVLGKTLIRSIEASNCIFTSDVFAARRQIGCVRFSYLPLASRAPRRYRCQPDLSGEPIRVRPLFNSTRYGDASYCQLSQRCAVEIRQGADDEAEMGAFHELLQPQRETNLRVRLDEYLRFSLEAGIFYAT